MDWQKTWSKRFSIRLGENWVYSVKQFDDIFGIRFPDQAIVIEEGIGKGFLDAAQLAACSRFTLEKLQEKPFQDYFEEKAVPVFQNFLIECKKMGKTNISTLSNAQLESMLNEFLIKEDEWMNYVWYVFLLDGIISSKLEDLLKKNWPDNYPQILKMALQSPKRTAASKYKIELLKAAILSKKNSPHSNLRKKTIERIAKKFSYFPILNMDEKPLAYDVVEQQLNEVMQTIADPKKEIDELLSSEKELESQYRKFIRSVKDESLHNFIDAAHRVAYYREYRNDLRQMSYFHARKIYTEISRRLSIDISEVIFLTRDEIRKSLMKGKSLIRKDEIQKRIKHSGLMITRGRVKYIFDETQLSTLRNELNRHELYSEQWDQYRKSGIIIGTIANPGRAKGKVKIVLNMLMDAHKFKRGDILVATTTNLSFLPLMEKAAAIVIDEGGLLTHAAIVSRELGKPCISGTKIATKALHDGDVVEIVGNKVKKE